MKTDHQFQFVRFSLIIFLLLMLLVVAVNRVQSQGMTIYRDILYYAADIPEARLEVYLPENVEAPYPTVVYVTPDISR